MHNTPSSLTSQAHCHYDIQLSESQGILDVRGQFVMSLLLGDWEKGPTGLGGQEPVGTEYGQANADKEEEHGCLGDGCLIGLAATDLPESVGNKPSVYPG